MFQTLDVLIGFSLVMLIMSMAVTMMTQGIGTSMLNLKGRALRKVISRVLALLDRDLSVKDAHAIANCILRDPLIAPPKKLWWGNALATVVHREELVKLILDFATKGDASKAAAHSANSGDTSKGAPQNASDGDGSNDSPQKTSNKGGSPWAWWIARKEKKLKKLRQNLKDSLARNELKDPADVLKAIRGSILELEKTSPELSTNMRASIAILTHASSDFLAKVNSWFDQSIDRASDIFTTNIRIVTLLISLVVAVLFQLNTFELLNRLSVDHNLRDQLVAAAIKRVDNGQPPAAIVTPVTTTAGAAPAGPNAKPAPVLLAAPTPKLSTTANSPAATASNSVAVTNTAGASSPQKTATTATDNQPLDVQQIMKASGADQLERYGLISFPESANEWSSRWSRGGGHWDDILLRLMGILLSAALLSLGAPFWYSALANLLKLRSVISRKDDDQRTERQTTQTVQPVTVVLPPT